MNTPIVVCHCHLKNTIMKLTFLVSFICLVTTFVVALPVDSHPIEDKDKGKEISNETSLLNQSHMDKGKGKEISNRTPPSDQSHELFLWWYNMPASRRYFPTPRYQWGIYLAPPKGDKLGTIYSVEHPAFEPLDKPVVPKTYQSNMDSEWHQHLLGKINAKQLEDHYQTHKNEQLGGGKAAIPLWTRNFIEGLRSAALLDAESSKGGYEYVGFYADGKLG